MALSGQTLKSRVLRGGALLGFSSSMEHGVRFVRNMILTRILLPDALGVMAIILTINAAMESFTEVGVREAVVQHPDAELHTFLNAAWWFAMGRGILLCAIGFLLARPLASFYHIEQARHLLLLSFTVILLNASISTKTHVALKKMHYIRWVAIMHGSALGGVCVTLVFLWLLGDIRALVYGYIGESVIRLVLSFILCPFKPSFSFEKSQTKELFRFANGMAGAPFLSFLFLQADIFVLGITANKHDLGQYGMAESLASAPTVLISVFINPILMPAFAQIRNQYERINGALLKATRAMSLTGFLLCAWVVLFGAEILRISYGPNYDAVGTVFAILFFGEVLRTMASPIPAIYLGIGKPGLNRIFTGIRAGVVILIIYPCILLFGLKGAASAGAFAMILAWVFQVRQMVALTNLDVGKYCRSVASGMGGAGIVMAGGILARMALDSTVLVVVLVGILTAGVLALSVPHLIRDLRSSHGDESQGSGEIAIGTTSLSVNKA